MICVWSQFSNIGPLLKFDHYISSLRSWWIFDQKGCTSQAVSKGQNLKCHSEEKHKEENIFHFNKPESWVFVHKVFGGFINIHQWINSRTLKSVRFYSWGLIFHTNIFPRGLECQNAEIANVCKYLIWQGEFIFHPNNIWRCKINKEPTWHNYATSWSAQIYMTQSWTI